MEQICRSGIHSKIDSHWLICTNRERESNGNMAAVNGRIDLSVYHIYLYARHMHGYGVR